jgi:hypothetical protein
LGNKNILFAKKNEPAAEQSGQQKENKTLPGCRAQQDPRNLVGKQKKLMVHRKTNGNVDST